MKDAMLQIWKVHFPLFKLLNLVVFQNALEWVHQAKFEG